MATTKSTGTSSSSHTTNNVALITGASSGIGRELARYHALVMGGDCILVARRKQALKELQQELEEESAKKNNDGKPSIRCHVIVSDLSKLGAAQQLYHDVTQLKNIGPIKILINNAGFGGQGSIIDREIVDDVNMIMVNVVSATILTKLIAKDMAQNGSGGQILNVSSAASFMPGPFEAVYFATKAYMTSFSQAIDEELRHDHNITSTVICPGLVNTNFIQVAKLHDTRKVSQLSIATPESVAKIGYTSMIQKQLVVVNEYGLTFLVNWVVPLLPRRLVLKLGAILSK